MNFEKSELIVTNATLIDGLIRYEVTAIEEERKRRARVQPKPFYKGVSRGKRTRR